MRSQKWNQPDISGASLSLSETSSTTSSYDKEELTVTSKMPEKGLNDSKVNVQYHADTDVTFATKSSKGKNVLQKSEVSSEAHALGVAESGFANDVNANKDASSHYSISALEDQFVNEGKKLTEELLALIKSKQAIVSKMRAEPQSSFAEDTDRQVKDNHRAEFGGLEPQAQNTSEEIFKNEIEEQKVEIAYLNRRIESLEGKLDVQRDENLQLKDIKRDLLLRIDELNNSLSVKSKIFTKQIARLNNLNQDLPVHELFMRIGISLCHRKLEWEHNPNERNYDLILEGNKVAHFSTCLADAHLFFAHPSDADNGAPSLLFKLLGKPRTDREIYKLFYGTPPENVFNFRDVEEFIQMVDYRGAMFKFVGKEAYPDSYFAKLMLRMNALVLGSTKEDMENTFKSQKGKLILEEMKGVHDETAQNHFEAREQKKRR